MPLRSDSDEERHLVAVAADRIKTEAAYESLQVAMSTAEARVREARAAESGAVRAATARLQRIFSEQQRREDVDEAAEVANHDRIVADTKRQRVAAAAERGSRNARFGSLFHI